MLSILQRYRQTDRQTDRRTTYDSNTALALRKSWTKSVGVEVVEKALLVLNAV